MFNPATHKYNKLGLHLSLTKSIKIDLKNKKIKIELKFNLLLIH